MLQAIRDKVTGWIAYGIIFLISIPFALWGVNSYLGGGEAAPVAVVNGEEISFNEFEQAYASSRQRLARMFGGSIPEALGGEEALREQVREQIIERYALRQYVDESRYRIGDAELSRMIRGMREFQRDGQFDTAIYEAQLRSLGYSPLGFEAEMRQSGALEQMQAGITATAFATPRTRQQLVDLNQQTRKLRILRHGVDADAIEVSEAEIEADYAENKARYRTAEQLKVDYIEVSLDSIKAKINVDEDTLRARYAGNLHHYTTPEVREASHILIEVDDQTDRDAALEKIRSIRARIEAGEDFAALAREMSEDPVSAAEGGNLGEIERGVMVKAFEETLFSLAVGELSEPVETGFGWHLISLHSVSGGESRSFESVRDELEDEIRTERAESQIFDIVETLANMAYEQSDSLRPAAEQLDLELRTSDWFSRFDGAGLTAIDAIRQAAFSDEVKRQGLNSEAIELDPERVVFLRVNEIKPAEQQPLEAVRDSIRARLVTEKQRQLSRQAGEQALAALQAGDTSLNQLAGQWDAEIEDRGYVDRQQAGIDATVRNRAFRMPRPGQGPVYDGLSLASGEYVIIELSEIASDDSDAARDLPEQLVNALGNAEYRAAIQWLTGRADIQRTPLEELY